jgi:hypothetical protein
MPRNRYISHGTQSEKDLLADLIAESIQVYGHDMYYIPRKIVKLDKILNEDTLSNFPDAYMVEMYVESIDGFEGDGKLITKFGLEIRDQLTLAVSVRRWNQLVGRFGYPAEQVRPAEGDLIYVPLTKGLFEIKFVEDKKPFFQLNNTPVYKLIVELYEYPSTSSIDTGIPEIDEIQSYSSLGFSVLIEYGGVSNERFVIGDKVTMLMPDASTGSCEILDVHETTNASVNKVYLGPITYDNGLFSPLVPDTVLTHTVSGLEGTITEVFTLNNAGDDTTFVNDDNAQNSSFENEGNAFIDFSEANPFGEIQLP